MGTQSGARAKSVSGIHRQFLNHSMLSSGSLNLVDDVWSCCALTSRKGAETQSVGSLDSIPLFLCALAALRETLFFHRIIIRQKNGWAKE
jgi:hypothetical protein